MQAHVHSLRVRYAECDPQGIVFNANYLMYFDVAFTELWREGVGEWKQTEDRAVNLVVADAGLSFHASARFDDVLELRSRVLRIGSTSLSTGYEVIRGDELLVAGKLVHVCVSSETWKKIELPEWVRAGMRRFAEADAEQVADPA